MLIANRVNANKDDGGVKINGTYCRCGFTER